MSHPVYPFREVLKELRRQSGLTVLGAAEATSYSNYERWESGQTRVGAQHLRSLAEAFAVTDDLHLLLYAWLVDRLSPLPGKPAETLDLDALRRHVRDSPGAEVDLGEHKHLVVEPTRHIDLALLCLTARYVRDGRLVVPAVERSPLPPPAAGQALLPILYGDVVNDAMAKVGRVLLAQGLDNRTDVDLSNIGPALASSDFIRSLADELDAIEATEDRPLLRFATGTAADMRHFAELLPRLREKLRELLEAGDGRPPADEDVDQLMAAVMSGNTLAVVKPLLRAARRGRLPDVDDDLTKELLAIRARVSDSWRAAAERQIVSDLQHANASEVFEALEALQADQRA